MPDAPADKKYKPLLTLPLAVMILGGIVGVFTTLHIDIKATLSLLESRYEERTVTADEWLKRIEQEQSRARNTRAMLRELIATMAEKISGQDIADAELLASIKAIQRIESDVKGLRREYQTLSNILKAHIDLRGHHRPRYPTPGPQ